MTPTRGTSAGGRDVTRTVITMFCTRAMCGRLDALAKHHGITRSAVLRNMVECVLPVFEAEGQLLPNAGRRYYYNYAVGSAEYALTRYSKSGELSHLRRAVRSLLWELEHREKAHGQAPEEEAPVGEAGAGKT